MSKKYLVPPLGYVITGKHITMDDLEGLKVLAHSMVVESATDFHQAVDKMNLEEIQRFFLENGHAFEEIDHD